MPRKTKRKHPTLGENRQLLWLNFDHEAFFHLFLLRLAKIRLGLELTEPLPMRFLPPQEQIEELQLSKNDLVQELIAWQSMTGEECLAAYRVLFTKKGQPRKRAGKFDPLAQAKGEIPKGLMSMPISQARSTLMNLMSMVNRWKYPEGMESIKQTALSEVETHLDRLQSMDMDAGVHQYLPPPPEVKEEGEEEKAGEDSTALVPSQQETGLTEWQELYQMQDQRWEVTVETAIELVTTDPEQEKAEIWRAESIDEVMLKLDEVDNQVKQLLQQYQTKNKQLQSLRLKLGDVDALERIEMQNYQRRYRSNP